MSKTERDVGDLLKLTEPHDILKYGLIPELVGRLPVITTLDALSRDTLVKVLVEPKNSFVKQYKKLLRLDGINLEFEPEALEYIADLAYKRGMGARGLRSIIEDTMSDIMFDAPSDPTITDITVTREATEKLEPPIILRDPALAERRERRAGSDGARRSSAS